VTDQPTGEERSEKKNAKRRRHMGPRMRRRVMLMHDGELDQDDCCGEGLFHSASGEPLHAAIEAALTDRAHGVSVRVNEDILAKLDVLVEAGICESRSAAATFLIREGAEANSELFTAVESTTQQIADLKEQLRDRLAELGMEPEGDLG
jgi:Arc/MetJ-type ribon-helix-helix transcriptional regulator